MEKIHDNPNFLNKPAIVAKVDKEMPDTGKVKGKRKVTPTAYRSEKVAVRFTPETVYLLNQNAKSMGMTKTAYLERLIHLDKMSDKAYDPRKALKTMINVQQLTIENREAMKEELRETQEMINAIPSKGVNQELVDVFIQSVKSLFNAFNIRSELLSQKLYELMSDIPASVPLSDNFTRAMGVKEDRSDDNA